VDVQITDSDVVRGSIVGAAVIDVQAGGGGVLDFQITYDDIVHVGQLEGRDTTLDNWPLGRIGRPDDRWAWQRYPGNYRPRFRRCKCRDAGESRYRGPVPARAAANSTEVLTYTI